MVCIGDISQPCDVGLLEMVGTVCPSQILQLNGENDDDQLDFGVSHFQTKLHVAQVWTILLPCEATIFCLKILIWLQRMSVGWMPTNPKSTHVTTLRSGSRLWWRLRWWNGRMITKSTLTFRPLSAEGVLFQSFSLVLGCFGYMFHFRNVYTCKSKLIFLKAAQLHAGLLRLQWCPLCQQCLRSRYKGCAVTWQQLWGQHVKSYLNFLFQ